MATSIPEHPTECGEKIGNGVSRIHSLTRQMLKETMILTLNDYITYINPIQDAK